MAMLVLCLGIDSQHVCDYSNSSSCLLLMLFYAIKQLLRASYLGRATGLLGNLVHDVSRTKQCNTIQNTSMASDIQET